MEELSGSLDVLYLKAPRVGRGLSIFEIHKDENSTLFDLFLELGQPNLKMIDIDQDLADTDRVFLLEKGAIISSTEVPELPLFSCELSSVKPKQNDGDLFVNSTLRSQPFDLTSFTNLVNERHISPFKASAWIRSPRSGIEYGYWLDTGDAKIIQDLIPDKVASIENEELCGRLYSAGILVDRANGKMDAIDREIADAAASYSQYKYAVIRNLLPPEQMSAMRSYYRNYVANGFMHFGDNQVAGRYREQNEPIAASLHHQLVDVVSKVAGRSVKPSYVYAASYLSGTELLPHTDREQCEYSISMQIDYEPEPDGHISPWALGVAPLDTDDLDPLGTYVGWEYLTPSRKCVDVHLASGDGLFYKGRELVHYRTALPHGHRSTSLFFHYVDADFDGKLD